MKPKQVNQLVQGSMEILAPLKSEPSQSKSIAHSEHSYREFCGKANLASSQGVYLPLHGHAHVPLDHEYAPLTLLHEYFGHGSFYEHASLGKWITNTERHLAREYCPKLRGELEDICKAQYHIYEGMALWMEHYLGSQLGLEDLFEKKMDLPEAVHNKSLFLSMKDWESKYGTYSLLYQTGYPRYADGEIVNDILEHIVPQYNEVELTIHFGSMKPYSDIDVWVLGEDIPQVYNEWLDLHPNTWNDVNRGIDSLDVAITHAVVRGNCVKGDPGLQSELQRRIHATPVSEKTVNANVRLGRNSKELAMQWPEDSAERKASLRMASTYFFVAEKMREGVKILTLQELRAAGWNDPKLENDW